MFRLFGKMPDPMSRIYVGNAKGSSWKARFLGTRSWLPSDFEGASKSSYKLAAEKSTGSEALLGTAREALSDHINLVYCLSVIPHSLRGSKLFAVFSRHACALSVESFLVGTGKGDARGRPWERYHAQVLPFRTEYLNAGISRRDVKTTLRVDGHAVA